MANKEISIGVKLITDLKDFISGFRQAQDTSAKFGESIEQKVSVPLNKLEGQLRSLRAAQKRSLSPEDYAKIGSEINKVQSDIDRFKGKTTQSTGAIGQMIDSAKGLLPAFGFAAIGAAGTYAVKQIISSTDTLATDWEATTNGMSNGLNEFWRTLATGDWSNFLDRIKEAVKVGQEYIYTLDDIEDKTRSLSIREAEAQGKIIALEEALKNKTLSKQERIKAGQERIQLEKDLATDREKVAQETFDNEAMLTAQQTKLSKDALMAVMRDMDSETKQRAKAYNEQLKQYESLRKANQSVSVQGSAGTMVYTQLADTEQMRELKKVIAAATPATKLYAEQIAKTGNTTDEQLDKMVSSYTNLLEAQNSARGNIKKVVTSVNSLLAGEEDTGQKIIDKQNSIDAQINSYKSQLDTSKKLTIEEIQAINQKITALEKLKKAYADIASDPASFRSDKLSTIQTGRVTGKLQVTSGAKKKEVDVYSSNYSKSNASEPLQGMGDYLDANNEKLQRFIDTAKETDQVTSSLESLSGSFGMLGDSIGGAAGSFLGMVSTILSMIPTLIAQIGALTTAQVASSQATTAAKGSEAIASGTAASQSMPFPLNLIALAATIAAIVSALATPVKGYATGGVVPGNSFTGDNILARVNSGEEILTATDPRHRNNRGFGRQQNQQQGITILNQAVIKGEDLHILMKKAESRINRRT